MHGDRFSSCHDIRSLFVGEYYFKEVLCFPRLIGPEPNFQKKYELMLGLTYERQGPIGL